jgi:hypothetical protein
MKPARNESCCSFWTGDKTGPGMKQVCIGQFVSSRPGFHPLLGTCGSYPFRASREAQTHGAGGASGGVGGSKAAALRLLPRRVETVAGMFGSAPSPTGSCCGKRHGRCGRGVVLHGGRAQCHEADHGPSSQKRARAKLRSSALRASATCSCESARCRARRAPRAGHPADCSGTPASSPQRHARRPPCAHAGHPEDTLGVWNVGVGQTPGSPASCCLSSTRTTSSHGSPVPSCACIGNLFMLYPV